MSLACTECNRNMTSGSELPGREGVLVYPSVLGLVFRRDKESGEVSYELNYVDTQENCSLCFGCLEGGFGGDSIDGLKKVYSVYELEMDFRAKEKDRKPGWYDIRYDEVHELEMAYFEMVKGIGEGCLFTGNPIRNGNPYFVARVLSRVDSISNLFGNYSTLGLEKSMTHFNIGFEALKDRFPRTFEFLSCDLTGNPLPKDLVPKSELIISKRAVLAFETETGKDIETLVDESLNGFDCLKVRWDS